MENPTPAQQLVPILSSAIMPGFGQFLQGRFAMAAAQFLLTGVLYSMCSEGPTLALFILFAHGLSAHSAATFRRSAPA